MRAATSLLILACAHAAPLTVAPLACARAEAQEQPTGTEAGKQGAAGADLAKRQRDAWANVHREASELAKWCDRTGYAAGKARALRLAARFGQAGSANIRPSPAVADQGRDANEPKAFQEAAAGLRKAAAPLEGLWRDALKAGLPGMAVECCQDLLAADPDHRAAREAFRYALHEGQWVTPAGKKRLESGMVCDPRFGWVGREDQEKLRSGLRPAGRRFVSKEEADRIHSDKNDPYSVQTEHFTVYCCCPLEEGLRVGEEAEMVYDALLRLLPDFLAEEGAPDGLPDVGKSPSKQMRIFYAKDREQYLALGLNPMSKGLYEVARGISYFYPYAKTDTHVQRAIFRHEVTHQILDAYSPIGSLRLFVQGNRSANGWVVEGVAACMEGLADRGGGKLVLSDPDRPLSDYFASTTQTATGESSTLAILGPLRLRLFSGYVAGKKNEPLPKFLALSYTEWGSGATLRYEQGAALAYFLLRTAEGKYQRPFGQYVRAYYRAQAQEADALTRFVPAKIEDLEREWLAEMAKLKPIH